MTIGTQTSGFGSYLENILPKEQAVACGAFAASMSQVKNINTIPIEKFSQVVVGLESMRGLVTGDTSVPVNLSLAASANTNLARGSGPFGTYTAGDFFGCMSGTTYNYPDTAAALASVNTTALNTTYSAMVTLLSGPGPAYNAALAALIATASAQIVAISIAQPQQVADINSKWNNIGTQYVYEKNARDRGLAIPPPKDSDRPLNSSPTTQISFISMIAEFAKDTTPHGWAQTLEAISDWSTPGGQSVVGLMRESRNSARLQTIGLELDNTINDSLDDDVLIDLIANGDSNLYTPSGLYDADALGFYDNDLDEYVITNSNFSGINGISDFSNTELSTNNGNAIIGVNSLGQPVYGQAGSESQASPFVLDRGLPIIPGSMAGVSQSSLLPTSLPPNLNSAYTSKQLSSSLYNPAQAATEVELRNCECWNT